MALVLGSLSCSHNGALAANAALNTPAARPRHVAIAARSWAGSPQSLVAAADDLLVGTGLFEEKGTSILWFEDRAAAGGYMVAGGYLFRTTASVRQIQDALQAVEQRLNDGQPPRVGGFLKMDLLWVEGMSVQTANLKLPNPLVIKEAWATNLFVDIAEDPFTDGCRARAEPWWFCLAVAKDARKSKRMEAYQTPLGTWTGIEIADAALVAVGRCHVLNEEILAVAADALLAGGEAQAILKRASPEREHRSPNRHLAEDVQSAVLARKPAEVFPIEIKLPAGNMEERATSFLKTLIIKMKTQSLLATRVVVFHLDAFGMRGAVVGRKTTNGEATPLILVPTVKVSDNPGSPGEPRSWLIELSVPLAGGR